MRSIVHWARLSGAPQPPERDWHEVYNPQNSHSWISGQIDYFDRRGDQRKRAVAFTKTLSWEAFFAAQFLAVWLLLVVVVANRHFSKIDNFLDGLSIVNWGVPAAFLAAAAALWIARHMRKRTAPAPRHWAAIFAGVLALLIGPGLHLLGILLKPTIPHADQLTIALGVVLLSAAAVAVRFVAEKLVWEAEAHRYEAALVLFKRAARELDHVGPPTVAGQTIIRALGRAALEENEYWLRAHRERPVEQAVG